MTLHTPGPYTVGEPYSDRPDFAQIDAPTWGSLAEVVVSMEGVPSPEGKANLALFLAAPDLLDTLSAMVERMERTGREGNLLDKVLADKARAAIAKAEGRS